MDGPPDHALVSRSQTAFSSFIFGWEVQIQKKKKRSGYARLTMHGCHTWSRGTIYGTLNHYSWSSLATDAGSPTAGPFTGVAASVAKYT